MNFDRLQMPIAVALSAAIFSFAALSAQAIRLADGTTYFANPPRLMTATTTQKGANSPGARYYFTLTIPENAGEPLQKVAIAQQQNTASPRFDLNRTDAFEGTRNRPSARLSLKQVAIDPQTRGIKVIFDPPVPPGKTVTIRLYATRNPNVGGVYLYGVTAFPTGEKPHAQFLGFGRIQIYEANNDG
ncbi:MAG TPA: hypothetical protein DCY88_09325 [Cyanobacteria bacterium UBA11372]|nr:hypothetical protein [Cyanobacteria bacterium UBA11372]